MTDTLEVVTLLLARAAHADTAALDELVDEVVASTRTGAVIRLLAALAAEYMVPADLDALAGLSAAAEEMPQWL